MKKWQDKVMMIVGFCFGFMLIPMFIDSLNGNPTNSISAGLTMIGVYIISICTYTLDLKLSFVSNLFTGSMWTILFILSIII